MRSLSAYWNDLKEKMVNDRMSPERVAAGWAVGMFVGCAVPFGFQLVVSMPLAVLFKISKIGASVGTLVTNPVTIFFIYPAQTVVMFNLLFRGSEMGELPKEWTRQTVMSLSGSVIASFFLGGLALAVILTPITYFVVRNIVVKYRKFADRRAKAR